MYVLSFTYIEKIIGRSRNKKYFRELIILSSVFWILLAIDISRMNIYYNKRILTDAMFTCMGEIYLLKDKTFFSRTITLKIKLSFIICSTSLNPYWYYLKCNLGFWYLFVVTVKIQWKFQGHVRLKLFILYCLNTFIFLHFFVMFNSWMKVNWKRISKAHFKV